MSENVKGMGARHDSHEAIEADAAKDPCTYFNDEVPMRCADCLVGNGEGDVDFRDCVISQIDDLARRRIELTEVEGA